MRVQQAQPRLWPPLCENCMACESNVNCPNILPETKEMEKKLRKLGKWRKWMKMRNQHHLTIGLDFFSSTLYSTSTIRLYKNRVPINSIDGPLKSIYNVSIWSIWNSHPTSPIHVNYIIHEQSNNSVHSPLKLIYYVSIWLCEICQTPSPIHINYIICEKSFITHQFVVKIHHDESPRKTTIY